MEGCSEGCGISGFESVVNQWVLDYFFHLAMEAFRTGRHDDFAEIRDIISVLIQRPFVCMEKNTDILRVMQCLSRIEEGEDTDCTFDEENSETPLESAVGILDLINSEMSLDKEVIKANKQMLKEAAVVACIKKQQFGKASKILKKYIPNHSVTKELRKDLLRIIQSKSLNHPLVANFSLSAIKQKMYEMFEKQINNTPSFLLTVAQKGHADLNAESKGPQTPKLQPKQRMENEQVQNESPSTSKLKTPKSHHKDSTNTPKGVVSKDCIVNKSSNVSEQDTWSDEDALFRPEISVERGASKATNNTSSPVVRKQKWTVEETEWIRCGVKKYGEGNWSKILRNYAFRNRTSVMIKDRWRTMKKLSLV
ncbi:telomeric repeat-binding factor 2 isoform X3 [Pseudophryne corroboree]|uniref:telomeric repeat-binding factor 2 isoform X3 n=1 Tax=Pseudophryne corroboree TaxID=495146 RepID=UPI003081662D